MMHTTMRRAARLGAALVLVLVSAACVVTPLTGPGEIALPTGFDVSLVGYQKSEFFLTGPANSYGPAAPLTTDGRWTVTGDNGAAAYKTRLVAYRPADPADFNGTVIVEWLNVTAGADLANDWVFASREFVRNGYAWVGVSAQAVGVNQLKTARPDRYSALNHPGDSYSYDIFTHAGQRVRDTPALLGGLVPDKVIATGESQSASRLVTYINAFQKRTRVYDGYLVHSRSAGASSLRQAPLAPATAPVPALIRDDLDVPVMVLQAEGDVIGSNLGARQPDTPLFRSWEMAGTSHADAYLINVGFNDIGTGSAETQMFNFMRTPLDAGCTSPINAGPHTWIMRAAIDGLDTWARTGVPPAVGPLLEVASTSPVVLARDANGNALGGIRSPHVDAPVATLTGVNTGPAFCRLFGSTTPFTPAQLLALYPTHQDFVDAWSDALDDAVAAGFILQDDVAFLLASAQGAAIPS